MEKYIIKGGKQLQGEVTISAAKNSAVAILPAVLLSDEPCIIDNVPNIDMDETLKNHLIGEAKFFRGMMYFDLIRMFGDVPLREHDIESADEQIIERSPKDKIYELIFSDLKYAEQELKRILEKLAAYLFNETIEGNVWDDIIKLENDLETYTDMAYEYQNNTFQSHPSYYIHYFEMRTKQCNVLHNLHYEMKRIRSLPKQAQIVGKYIIYLKDYVEERNDPVKQIHKLEQLFEDMKKEDLPKSREEFENRAKLYHILMDLEEFLVFKRRFIESLDERQKKIYWGEEKKKKISKNSQYYK